MRRKLWLLLSLGALLAMSACGDEGQKCGEGTVADGDECVPEGEAVECGPGTVEQGGECVPEEEGEEVECGEGTTLTGGECLPDIECGEGTELVGKDCVPVAVVECGEGTELVDGQCVSTIEEIECGAGTILIDGVCDLIDPFDGIEKEADEPNDPFFFGEDANVDVIALGRPGEAVLRTGNIDAATDLGEGLLAPDFDVMVFAGEAGTRLTLEATAVGAPSVAVALLYIPEGDDDERTLIRLAFPFGSRNASKEVMLPFDGNYMVRVGDPDDTATFIANISEGQLNIGGLLGDPTGAEDFTWILGLTVQAPKDPTTFAGNGTFTFEGDVREAPQALVEVEAGTIIGLGLETGPSVAGAFFTTDEDFGGFLDNPGLVVVPEGGLLITVDSIVDRALDTSFTLTAIEQPRLPQGDLAAGESIDVSETLVGNTLQFLSFTLTDPAVVSVSGGPDEGSDANIGLFLTTGGLEQAIAASNDNLFGEASNEEFMAAALAPGDYQVVILHEEFDEENGQHPYVVTISAQGLIELEDLVVDGEQTVTDDTLGAFGAQSFYTVDVTSLGLFAATAAPQAELNVDLDIFSQPFLAARDQILSDVDADEGFEGDAEFGELPVAAGRLFVRLANVGFDAEVDFEVDLTVGLEAIAEEVEPNDDAGDATDLGLLEDELLVGGRLAADVETTADFFTFEVDGISGVTITAVGIGADPAQGLRLSLFDDNDINEPLAVEETFVDFFSGQAIDPVINIVLEPGVYVVSLVQIDDTPTGSYLIGVTLNDIFVCLPGSAICNGNTLEVCADGFEVEATDCGGAICGQVGDTFGCGLLEEIEPNNDVDNAQVLGELGGATELVAALVPDGDVDFYSFTLTERALVTAGTAFSEAPRADTILTLCEAGQSCTGDDVIASNDDIGGGNFFSQVTDVPLEAGDYLIKVEGFSGGGGNYRLVLDITLAECEFGDAICGEEGVLGCDGFLFVLEDACSFGCEVGEGGPFCVVPDFVPEEEPNDLPAIEGVNVAPDLPITFQGRIDPVGDRDFYVFTAPFDGRYLIETSDFGDDEIGDTLIALCNAEQVFSEEGCAFGGFNIDDDDDGGERLYSLIDIDLEAGLYFVVVEPFRDSQGDYLLDISIASPPGEPNDSQEEATPIVFTQEGLAFAIDQPGDGDFYTFTVSQAQIDGAGGALDVRITTLPQEGGDALDSVLFLCEAGQACNFNDSLADNDDGGIGGGLYSQIEFTFTTPGDFFVLVQAFGGGTGDYVLELSLDQNERNDTPDTASQIAPGDIVLSDIFSGGDQDWYSLSVVGTTSFVIETAPIGGFANMDTLMFICDDTDPTNCTFNDGNIGADDNGGDENFSQILIELDAGDYFVVVIGFGSARGQYALSVLAD